ncbi:hypothetical protein G6514_002396 [Epicoccum nigrum]|nr:hypothetical protein G6514_002396 [Epicoccum nigrum]
MATPSLMTIPIELRELIYGFLFSSYTITRGHRGPSRLATQVTPSPRAALLLSIITRLRHIQIRAFPFPLYADNKAEYYPTYYFANALSLFPGLCLDHLEVYDCWHGHGQGDGWRDLTTYLDMESLLKSDAWKSLTYITPCTDFIASGYDHRRKRQQQPENWDALLKERDGNDSGASVQMWIVPLKQAEAREEGRTEDGRKMHEWSALPGHEILQNWRLAPPEQNLKGEVRIVATRGKRARAVQIGAQEKASWKDLKECESGFVREDWTPYHNDMADAMGWIYGGYGRRMQLAHQALSS